MAEYTGEITKDGKFQCYITGKTGYDYMTQCVLEFKSTPWRTRLLISDEALKSEVRKNENEFGEVDAVISKASDDDTFVCAISGITYKIKQELTHVYLPREGGFFDKPLFISRTSGLAAAEEHARNKIKREERYNPFS